MNKLFIIGNCTRDPETRTTTTGKTVCTFTVAVNRRKKVEGQPEADFFRVSAWEATGEVCQKYLAKGKKVSIVGSVSVHVYTNSKGEPSANMEVLANEVEFISPKDNADRSGMQVVEPKDNPFDNEMPF